MIPLPATVLLPGALHPCGIWATCRRQPLAERQPPLLSRVTQLTDL